MPDHTGIIARMDHRKDRIKRRYHVTKDETASSLAIAAARKAIQSSGIAKDKIGIVIIASFSQDYLFPPLSAKLHSSLELFQGLSNH